MSELSEDRKYMQRCLELAALGLGSTAPNPMVGCVIVAGGRILGEGFHREFGGPHAEVHAIGSVRDGELLKKSRLYVNLEPCSHQGKTPPCASLILSRGIPEVVIGMQDPNPLVGGNGIKILKDNGVKVTTGILETEARDLNRRFLSHHVRKRPWIILKWAQTRDGFMDRRREPGNDPDHREINWITGPGPRRWVHKWRAEEQAILVGTNTATIDDPQLTTRLWSGKDPLRLVIDLNGRLPADLKLFDGSASTLVFIRDASRMEKATGAGKTTEARITNDNAEPKGTGHAIKTGNSAKSENLTRNLDYIEVPGDTDVIPFLLEHLHSLDIQSLIVEGGAKLLGSFIGAGLWDEARVFIGDMEFGDGLQAPLLPVTPLQEIPFPGGILKLYKLAE